VLDRADDLSWAIMATPGGNYVWLLSRKPSLDDGLKAQLMARIKGLGYDLNKIVLPRQA
jgi:apolipoprotein D and lipocalin family protein